MWSWAESSFNKMFLGNIRNKTKTLSPSKSSVKFVNRTFKENSNFIETNFNKKNKVKGPVFQGKS